MDSQSTRQLIQIMVYMLIPIIISIFGLLAYLIYSKIKEKEQNEKKADKNEKTKQLENNNSNKQSIFNFMEFDEVEDSMIIQKNSTRFLMVVECQGVNYDLMSGVEKTSVEEGFVQFLNSLRNPVQIYIQTRSINLENSLEGYREKIKDIEIQYENMKKRYENIIDSNEYTKEQIAKVKYELTKQANLYEYALSIVKDTEKMSLNKNILNKNYYLVIPYYANETNSDKMDKKELKDVAFSELYTRAQSMISSISACGVKGKILRTKELVELLYMAYNRDEAETFSLDKALKAGFEEMYSTSTDVYEKKMKELDKIIEEKAIMKAKEKVNEAKNEIQRQVEEKEKNMDKFILEVAKSILEDNEEYIGKDIKEIAMNKLENTEEGGEVNGKKIRGKRKNTTV